MKVATYFFLATTAVVSLSGCSNNADTSVANQQQQQGPPTVPAVERAKDLAEPISLEADGSKIDIGALANQGHAGPCVADIDSDGDDDLLVGDFPGYFWFFENVSENSTPTYTAPVKLQAGGEDAKTPVY